MEKPRSSVNRAQAEKRVESGSLERGPRKVVMNNPDAKRCVFHAHTFR
jgi:hypothetical protein